MQIDPKFVRYFEDILLHQIPWAGCALDYDDPEEGDDDE